MTASFEMDSPVDWPIEVLPRAALGQAARLLADVFVDNPCYVFMHPRAAQRHADLLAFFERNLRWREALGLSFVARDARGAVVGTGTLEPPGGGVPRTLGKLLGHWIGPTLREQGLHTLARGVQAEREFARERRLAAGGPEHWYIHALAVRSDLRGRGLGSALLCRLLRERDAVLPVVLATQREANLRFFARFGFRARQRARLGATPRSAGFESWFMRCEPRAPGPPAAPVSG